MCGMRFEVMYRSTPVLLEDDSPLMSNNQWKHKKPSHNLFKASIYPSDSHPSQIPALEILIMSF